MSWFVWITVVFLFCRAGAEVAQLNEDVINSTFTHVQDSNLYCTSTAINRIVCNFNRTAARLGSISFLASNIQDDQTELHLEINNCSRLWISSEFQVDWRGPYRSLYLHINNVYEVIQEETDESAGGVVPISDLISFSMKNSKMTNIFPNLMSNTKALLVELLDSTIDTIAEGTFRKVDKLWQLRLFRVNITRIESRAAPNDDDRDVGGLTVAPAAVHVEWAPFILNETHVDLIEVDALSFNVSEKDEYLNIVNSHFGVIRSRGLKITGAGHVLVADSTFANLDNDAFVVQLQTEETDAIKLFAHPTLTFMGVHIFTANITNFLDNLQVTGGKMYLIRMNFQQPGALSSVVGHARLWNNRTTFIERWTVACSCDELARLIQPDETLLEDSTANYDDAADEHTPSSSHWKREVKCRAEESATSSDDSGDEKASLSLVSSVSLADFHKTNCSADTSVIIPPEEGIEVSENDTQVTESSEQPSSVTPEEEHQKLLLHLGVGGVCLFLLILAVVSVYLYRNRKVSFTLNRRVKGDRKQNRRPGANVSKKQVGVISEDPICGEDGEEECQL